MCRSYADTLLDEIRAHDKSVKEGKDTRYHERRLRWRFQELDEWLKAGGELPTEWNQPTSGSHAS